MIEAGKLDRRITLLTKIATRDAYGAEIETWSEGAAVWAQYLPGGGTERYASGRIYADTQARFRIRWRGDVSVANRIAFEGKNWEILAVDEIGRRVGLELKAKASA